MVANKKPLPKRQPGRDIKGRAIAKRRSPRIPMTDDELKPHVEKCAQLAIHYAAQRGYGRARLELERAFRLQSAWLSDDEWERGHAVLAEGWPFATLGPAFPVEIDFTDDPPPFEDAWFAVSEIDVEDAIVAMNKAAEIAAPRLPGDIRRSMRLTSRAIRKRQGKDAIEWRALQIGQVAKSVLARAKYDLETIERTRTNARFRANANVQRVVGILDEEIARAEPCRADAISQARHDKDIPEVREAWLDLLAAYDRARDLYVAEREHWRRMELSAA